MINLKLRLQNKVVVAMLITLAISFIYQGLNLFGIIPNIDQQAVLDWLMIGVEILCAFGIIMDPTTPGIGDSNVSLAKNNIEESAAMVIERNLTNADYADILNRAANLMEHEPKYSESEGTQNGN